MGVEGWFLHFEIPICDFGVEMIYCCTCWNVNVQKRILEIYRISNSYGPGEVNSLKSLAKSRVNLAIATDALAYIKAISAFIRNASQMTE